MGDHDDDEKDGVAIDRVHDDECQGKDRRRQLTFGREADEACDGRVGTAGVSQALREDPPPASLGTEQAVGDGPGDEQIGCGE